MMYVEFMKIFFSPIRVRWWVLDSFRPPEPKKVWFVPYTNHVRRIHEKSFGRGFERTDGCYTHFGLLSQKTFDSYFLDIMYVEIIKKILADSNKLFAVWLISSSWAQKRLIPTI